MSLDDSDIDVRLARLADATAELRPRADFTSRVMQRIEREHDEPVGVGAPTDNGIAALQRPVRRFFPISMLAAALALLWAVSVDRQLDEAMATSDDLELAAW